MTFGRGRNDSLGGSGGKEDAKERAGKLLMGKGRILLDGLRDFVDDLLKVSMDWICDGRDSTFCLFQRDIVAGFVGDGPFLVERARQFLVTTSEDMRG